MKISSMGDVWYYVVLVTFFSVAGSVLMTSFLVPGGLTATAAVPAIGVPLIVAPVTTFWTSRVHLRMHELNLRLIHLANHDQMTGLMNRAAFFRKAQRFADPKGFVLMIDIDKFKSINDTYGHPAGDTVIRDVAQVLARLCPEPCLSARFGGEEFVVLSNDRNLPEAEARGEAIRHAVETNRFHFGDVEVRCTVSIGIDQLDDPAGMDSALRRADEALYKAKASGRNRICRVERRGGVSLPVVTPCEAILPNERTEI